MFTVETKLYSQSPKWVKEVDVDEKEIAMGIAESLDFCYGVRIRNAENKIIMQFSNPSAIMPIEFENEEEF